MWPSPILPSASAGRWISAAWTARTAGRWPTMACGSLNPLLSPDGEWLLATVSATDSGSTTSALINLRTCRSHLPAASGQPPRLETIKLPFHSRDGAAVGVFAPRFPTKSLPFQGLGFPQRQSHGGPKYSPSGARFSRWKGEDGSSPIARQGFRLLKALRLPTAIPTLVGAVIWSLITRPTGLPNPTDRPAPPGRAAGRRAAGPLRLLEGQTGGRQPCRLIAALQARTDAEARWSCPACRGTMNTPLTRVPPCIEEMGVVAITFWRIPVLRRQPAFLYRRRPRPPHPARTRSRSSHGIDSPVGGASIAGRAGAAAPAWSFIRTITWPDCWRRVLLPPQIRLVRQGEQIVR